MNLKKRLIDSYQVVTQFIQGREREMKIYWNKNPVENAR